MNPSLQARLAALSIAVVTGCATVERNFTGGAGGAGGAGAGGMSASSSSGCVDGAPGCPCSPGNMCEAGATCIGGMCKAGCCSGYDLMGTQCTWGGGDKDPGFMDSAAWTTLGTAKIDPMPGIDPGRAFFDSNALCGYGAVTQTFPMPEISCAEPLVLNLNASTTCQGPPNLCLGPGRVSIIVGLNSGWTRISLPPNPGVVDDWHPYQVCVGARALDGPAKLFLGPAGKPGFCGASTLAFDAVTIDRDTKNACPPLGKVPNGDFEAGALSWVLNANTAVAEVKMGAGDGGSSGGHLATSVACTTPTITGTISLPTAAMVPHPALQIWSNINSGAMGAVRIGPDATTSLPGTGKGKTMNICLPQWALGTVQSIAFSLVDTLGNVGCGKPYARDFAFDDLTFISDPACADGAPLFDPGFEQVSLASTAAPFWNLQQYTDIAGASVSLKVDAASAHSGNVSAAFVASSTCQNASVSGSVTVPAPDAQGGPALKFWYKTGFQMAHEQPSVTMAAMSKGGMQLPLSTGWKQVTVCLDPTRATWPDVVSFSDYSGSGTCGTAYAAETFSVDDVALTTDASCPSM